MFAFLLGCVTGWAGTPTGPIHAIDHASRVPAVQLQDLLSTVLELSPAAINPAAWPPQRMATAGSLLHRFQREFQGHFDNHAQHLAEFAAGITPRAGGGHEHIHCSVQPVQVTGVEHAVLATYYFNGNPQHTFRQRIYRLRELNADSQFGRCIQMEIFRLREEVAEKLRVHGSAVASELSIEDFSPAYHIPGCDIFWRWCGERFEGHMRTDSVVVQSEVSNQDIIVKDHVALWDNALWVNDRGYDMDGNYIYGNINDVPYKLQRVPVSHWTSGGTTCL